MTFNQAIEAVVALNGGVERFTTGEANRLTGLLQGPERSSA